MTTTTKSVVGHMPDKWMKGLPFDLSAHYSESQNSSVSTARVDSNKQPLNPPQADTKDYGISMEFFQNRLSLGVNLYKMKATNQTLPGLSVQSAAGGFATLQLRNFRRHERAFGSTPAGFAASSPYTYPERQNFIF